jgi:hypothetical protein
VRRKLLRALNLTTYDPVKARSVLTAWERIAALLLGGGDT